MSLLCGLLSFLLVTGTKSCNSVKKFKCPSANPPTGVLTEAVLGSNSTIGISLKVHNCSTTSGEEEQIFSLNHVTINNMVLYAMAMYIYDGFPSPSKCPLIILYDQWYRVRMAEDANNTRDTTFWCDLQLSDCKAANWMCEGFPRATFEAKFARMINEIFSPSNVSLKADRELRILSFLRQERSSLRRNEFSIVSEPDWRGFCLMVGTVALIFIGLVVKHFCKIGRG